MRQVKVKKDKQLVDKESLSVEQAELSKIDNIISDFESKGLEKEHRKLEDELQNGNNRRREKGSTPEAL